MARLRSRIAETTYMTEKLVIIGNGMAPGRMLEHLFSKRRTAIRSRSSTPSRASTTTASCFRPCCPAKRPLTTSSSMTTAGTSSNNVTLYDGAKPSSPSTARPKRVETDARRDASPMTSWSSPRARTPFIIPVPGADLPGVADLPRSRRRRTPCCSRRQSRPGRGHRRRPARARSGGGPRSARA